ncbi:hypothetical protein NC796_04685 [Aliifodinibius sp. S!AR15-10]|uniref:hypothetical protein n=1 Tax=Aliifodinibius sp. S!AR15-10 TaxID=2950437 RepID=UPI00285C1ED5|nr:hypothetical protein [Aliifodinibius sp. S!AR15-10]MDR8390427.1 hypothetical protein [Aliifodinibius sp. S!AR15-10]
MSSQDPKETLLETIAILESKMDFLLRAFNAKPDKSRYMTAQDIEAEFRILQRTVLNRSNLPPAHKQFIPSLRVGGGRRKYFDRKVIERLFSANV